MTQAQNEFGVAVTNIAGNIEALLPRLAERGAEVAVAGNQIHDKLRALRQSGLDFQKADPSKLQEADFDKHAEAIAAVLPQLDGHGDEVAAISKGIRGYLNQLVNVHAQHLHLIAGADAELVPVPHVNNGVGSAPFDTGVGVVKGNADTSKIDPNPKPAGTGNASATVSVEPVVKVEITKDDSAT